MCPSEVGKVCDKVHGEKEPGSLWNRQWVEFTIGEVSRCLDLFAGGAGGEANPDVRGHQYFAERHSIVRAIPECPDASAMCAQARRWSRTSEGK